MRIEGGAPARDAGARDAGAARFRGALARAGAGDAAGAGRSEDRSPPRGAAPARAARSAAGEDARAAGGEAGPAAAPAAAQPQASEVAPVPELAQVARVLAPAIGVLGAAPGASLALSFGRSLDVELRATPAGVEVVLVPEPALAGAAHADLPRLVAALRVRGIAVASAAVRARGRPGRRPR